VAERLRGCRLGLRLSEAEAEIFSVSQESYSSSCIFTTSRILIRRSPSIAHEWVAEWINISVARITLPFFLHDVRVPSTIRNKVRAISNLIGSLIVNLYCLESVPDEQIRSSETALPFRFSESLSHCRSQQFQRCFF
jgi:hypothetical protein